MAKNNVNARQERATRRVETGAARSALDEIVRFAGLDELGGLLIRLRKVEGEDSTGLVATIANTISGAMKVRAGF